MKKKERKRREGRVEESRGRVGKDREDENKGREKS